MEDNKYKRFIEAEVKTKKSAKDKPAAPKAKPAMPSPMSQKIDSMVEAE